MPVGAFNFTKFAATGSALHSYTQSWVDRVITAGGTVSTARQTVVDTFVNGLITDGLLNGTTIASSIIHYMNLFATESFTGCQVPLIDAKSVGNATLVNFVGADYSSSGLAGNKIDKYLNTGYIPATHTVSASDGVACGVYSVSGAIDHLAEFGCESATTTMNVYGGSSFVGVDVYGANASASVSYAHGLNVGNLFGSTLRYLNDSNVRLSTSGTGTTLPDVPAYFFALNGSGSATNYTSYLIRLTLISRGLSTTHETALNSRVQTLVSSL